MGESQSKPKNQNKSTKKQEQRRSLSPIAQPKKKVKKNLPKIESSINADLIQEMFKREDPIKEYVKDQNSSENQQNQNFDITDCIDLQLVPRTNQIKLSSKQETNLPVMISLQTKQLENLKTNRAPIDLVCVIDDSGSMHGQKAQLVRKSLKYLLKILNEDDRICLISYDNSAKVLTPFLRNQEHNKPELKAAIKYIQGRGGTNTTTGMDHGLWMIKNRKQKNPVTCMFLLSDGVDNFGRDLSSRVESLVEQYDIQEQFTINTYGYGNDHDCDVLLNIAKQKDGNFYYIENLKKVSDWFILSLSGLLTVLAENIEIRLKQKDQVTIIKGYGDEQIWDSDFIIHLPHLVQDNKKEYLLELQIPRLKNKLQDHERQKIVLECELLGKALEGKLKNFNVKCKLEVQLFNEDEKIQDIEYKENFEVGYLRAKGGEIIGQACELSDKGKFDDANKLLDNFLKEIDECQFKEVQGIQFIRNDIVKSKERCQPRVFQQTGKAFMYKKKKDHIERQASMCCIEDWNDNQKEMVENYQNGDYQLSDDSCCSDMEDNNNRQINLSGIQQRRGSYIQQQKWGGSLEGSEISGEDDDYGMNHSGIIQHKQRRKSNTSILSLEQVNNNKSFSVDDDDDDQDEGVANSVNFKHRVPSKRNSINS